MNVIPKGAPAVNTPAGTSARDRAIATLNAANNPQPPVPNPSQVSPEELTAVKAASSEGQSNSNESSSSQKDEATTPKAAEPDPLSSQYAILARKEKALRAKVQAQENALKAKEEAIAKREAEIEAKSKSYETDYIPKSKLSEDTITTLLEAGITYDQITQMALNQGQTQVDPQTKLAIQRLEAQVKAQEEAYKQAQKQAQEAQTQQYQQAVAQIRNEATNLVNSDPNFETIQAAGAIDDVVELIESTFKADGVLLTVEEAATEVENYLMEKALKFSQLKKIQQRLQSKSQPSTPKQETEEPKQPPAQLKTLTNSVGVARSLTAKERAILAFKGELK